MGKLLVAMFGLGDILICYVSCTGERMSGAAVRAMCAALWNAPGRSAGTARQARKAWARIVAREDPLRILVPKLVGLVTRFSWASGHIYSCNRIG
jgi:hypothetical protein